MLFEKRWLIVGVTGLVLAFAAAYLSLATPVYEASVLIQVDEEKRTLPGLEDVSALVGDATSTDTKIELMRARSVLDAVIEQLGLDVEAASHTFPVVGAAIARKYRGPAPAPERFGLARFAWGGERIRIERLALPEELVGEPLVLTARGGSRYQLARRGGAILLEGEVGRPAQAEVGGNLMELRVSDLVARPGTEILVRKLSRSAAAERLQKALRIEEKGKKTGVVTMTLEGPDPARIAAILRALSETYVRQSVDRKDAEAGKTLGFLESQLPGMKSTVDKAEAALKRFQLKTGIVDLPLKIQSALARTAELERSLAELDGHRAELIQRYNDRHPDVAALAERIRVVKTQLEANRSEFDASVRLLPERDFETARLTRDVAVATELYLHLLKKAQELRVGRSGALGDVRIVDRALVPDRPSSPQPTAVLTLAMLLGLGAGVLVAIARKALDDGAEDPDEIEAGTGLPVFAAIPHSETQIGLARTGGRGTGRRLAALSIVDPGDAAVEDLRALRTSLQFTLLGARNGIVAIEGPAPGVGKSFVCVNLAHLLAAAERRVLLVDADLRRGILHRYFGMERGPGLAEVATGAATLESAIRHTDAPRLDLLTTGRLPPYPAELLASPPFQQLLEDAGHRYDVVILDTPPILSVTDAALVARHAGVNLLVLRAGQHPAREIALAVKRLAQNGVTVQGTILNDVHASSGRYGRYGDYRRYDERPTPRRSSAQVGTPAPKRPSSPPAGPA